MARWRRLWHLPSLTRSASAACAGDARAAQASCRPSRRGHSSHSCQRAAGVQGPRLPLPVGRPGGASAAPLAPSSAPPRPPSGTCETPTGRRRRSHSESQWELRKVPVGVSQVPVGVSQVPVGVPVGVAKRASKSEWERRGGPRRVPLGPPTGRRATTVRAPLPLGYLPSVEQPYRGRRVCCVHHVYHVPQLHTAHRPRPPPATERGERALAARGARCSLAIAQILAMAARSSGGAYPLTFLSGSSRCISAVQLGTKADGICQHGAPTLMGACAACAVACGVAYGARRGERDGVRRACGGPRRRAARCARPRAATCCDVPCACCGARGRAGLGGGLEEGVGEEEGC